jgi:mannitol/fructose-specific phosphotransferase system IIA component (Ntr-type)
VDSFRLTKNDVLVLIGGVNDVYDNNSRKVILQIMKFLQDTDNANIIMLDVPHR